MTIERVTYQKVFPLAQYVNEKIGVDYLLNEGDDPKAALKAAKDLCEEFHRESNNWPHPHIEERIIPDIHVQKPTSQSLEEQIMSCTEFKVLESYYLIVKNNPALQHVYDIKKKQLVEKESKEIIEKTNALLPKKSKLKP